jgi:type I restriction enzyme S subunit
LFGKRRAYQRKAAFAEFDAICSGDILVFQTDHQRMLPELLPFLVQSNGFYDHALGTSAGSLSPRTSWRDLANYEFDLPPLEEQRRIAELIWACENDYSAGRELLACLEVAAELWANKIFEGGDFAEAQLGEVLELCQYGLSTRAGEAGRYPMLRMTNLDDGRVTDDDLKYCDLSPEEFDVYRVDDGDLLFNRTNSVELVGRSGVFRLEGDFVFASYLVRLRPRKDLVLPDFMNMFINSPTGQSRIRRHLSKGVSQANISASKLKTVSIPLPSLGKQQSIVDHLDSLDGVRSAIRKRNMSSAALRAEIQRQVFGAD